HPKPMKFGSVQQFSKNQRDLLFNDSRAVILHADFETIGAGGFDVNPKFGDDTTLFASVEGVVHGFLDRGQKRLPWVIEAKEMSILSEKLADGDIALFFRHRF